MTNATKLKSSLVFAAVVLVTAGCSKNDPFFPEASNDRPSKDMVDAQVAAAAARSGNLYGSHFDGAEVTALGKEQLDAIVRGTSDSKPVVVRFAEGSDHDLTVRRMESVAAYLKDEGLADERIVFADRFDDSMYTPAAVGLSSLAKTDTTSAEGDAGQGAPEQYGTSMDIAK